jgi:hypothetical protein
MRLEIYDAKALNFVELNITGGNDTLIRCDRESKYIDSVVFNLFSPCYESANKLYEYYGPTKYNSRKIIPLRNELIKHLEDLQAIQSIDGFVALVTSHFLGVEFLDELKKSDEKWNTSWPEHLKKMIEINKEMVSIAERCAFEERILWVVGY